MGEWISVNDRMPEIKDDAVLAYWAENDGMDMVNIQDYFSEITAGLDENGNQLYTKWYLTVGITHWMPLPEPPR